MKYFETPRCTCCLSNNQNFCKLTHWTPSCHHIETSQLNCSANQLIGFYMINTLVLNDLSLTNGFLETKFWSLLISILWGDPFSTYKKLTFLTPLIRTRPCSYQGVWNINFSENFVKQMTPLIFPHFDCQRCFWYLISFKASAWVKSKFIFWVPIFSKFTS